MTFEEKIAKEVNKKLTDGTAERLAAEYMQKAVEKAFSDFFGWAGPGKKLLDEKIKEVMTPAIESFDFSRYTVKLDAVLGELIEETALADNRRILKNFQTLMRTPETKTVSVSELFREYCRFVAKEIDPKEAGLEIDYSDGEPAYEYCSARMETLDGRNYLSHDRKTLNFICEEQESLNRTIPVFRWSDDEPWRISAAVREDIGITSLRRLDSFKTCVLALYQAGTEIVLDKDDLEDQFEPDTKPEATYE